MDEDTRRRLQQKGWTLTPVTSWQMCWGCRMLRADHANRQKAIVIAVKDGERYPLCEYHAGELASGDLKTEG